MSAPSAGKWGGEKDGRKGVQSFLSSRGMGFQKKKGPAAALTYLKRGSALGGIGEGGEPTVK